MTSIEPPSIKPLNDRIGEIPITIRRQASRLQVTRAPLLRQVLRFNYAIAGDLHETCLKELTFGPQEWIERIRRQPRGDVKLTQLLNVSTGFAPLIPAQFQTPQLQAALLPSQVLVRLVQMCAASLLCESICNEIGRQRRIELEQALPPDVLLFARHRCRMTAAPVASRLMQTLLPYVADGTSCWSSRIEEMCRMVCGMLLEAHPVAIGKRIGFKLPREWCESNRVEADPTCDRIGLAWQLALRILESELLADWKACFN